MKSQTKILFFTTLYRAKETLKNMKNFGVKLEIQLKLKSQMIIIKNIWKSNLIQMMSYL